MVPEHKEGPKMWKLYQWQERKVLERHSGLRPEKYLLERRTKIPMVLCDWEN
jgi:hypothetical protein